MTPVMHQIYLEFLTILFVVIGAVFRRYWGGALDWPKKGKDAVRRALAFIIGFSVAFLTTSNIPVSIVFCIILGCIWWLQFGHGRAQDMGYGNPNGTLPRSMCFEIFWGVYGLRMAMAGVLWTAITGDHAGLIYAGLSILAPMPHYLAQVIWPYLKIDISNAKPGDWIDNPTCLGEFGLGALIIGGVPFAALMATFL